MVECVNLIILYEDDDVIAIDKYAGMPVIPERFKKEMPSIFMILNTYYLSRTTPHYYIVHRTDRDCSGIVLVAKNKNSHRNLCQQFERRAIHKEYLALV